MGETHLAAGLQTGANFRAQRRGKNLAQEIIRQLNATRIRGLAEITITHSINVMVKSIPWRVLSNIDLFF